MQRRTFLQSILPAAAVVPHLAAQPNSTWGGPVLDTHLHLRGDADECFTHIQGCGVTHAVLLTPAGDEDKAKAEMDRRPGHFARSVVIGNWHSTRFPTWEYEFTRAPEPRGAVHSWELQYVFGNLLKDAGEPADRALSGQVVTYWTNFARTGNPNGGSLPNWVKHDATTAAYIDFAPDGPVVREGLRKQACRLFQQSLSLTQR